MRQTVFGLFEICFNTQPPEGGWVTPTDSMSKNCCFNTQPPEGGWVVTRFLINFFDCRFNTQPPEGGWFIWELEFWVSRGFNTQPPEGGWRHSEIICFNIVKFQHTAA